ncbi:MAG: tetratricopeptide repeat protein [candidate division Zixibacteria bacterium]|nr:tetratricopeptide repeat protein [candidate division Zixibacteria bacterium]MBU1469097.1 tetratricopeptide repeat protein [candidate division Zixibacteria bacterium]MBU2624617.1 tetratricopeptide repeat protein [candidate division Zixibacteria bacterium]
MDKQSKDEAQFNHRNLAIVVAVALIVRLVYLIEASASPFFENLVADPRFYDLWSKSIARESFFPDFALFRAPLYAYFVGIFYAVSGNSKFVVGIVQAVVGSFSCGLTFLIARRFFSEKIAVTSGLIAALYGVFIYLGAGLFPSTLATFFLLLSLFYLARIDKDSPLKQYLFAGLFAGLAAITMPFLIIFGILVFVWILYRFRVSLMTKLSRWGVLLAGMSIIIAPLTFHNLSKSGNFILISSNIGIELFAGNNAASDGKTPYLVGQNPETMRNFVAAKNLAESLKKEELSARGVCTFYLDQSLTFLTREPGKALGNFTRKVSLLLNGHEIHSDGSVYFDRRFSTVLSVLVWDRSLSFPMGFLIPLSVVGLLLTIVAWRRLMLLYAFLVSTALVPFLLYVNIETRSPMLYVVIIFASVGIFEIINRVKAGEIRRLTIPILIFAAFLFMSNYDFVNLDEDYATQHLRLGTIAWNAGDTDRAERAYLDGLEINADSPTLLNGLGNVYSKQEVYQEAEKKYRRALSVRPDFYDARRNLILTLEKLQKDELLYDAYAEFLTYFPNSEFGLVRMAEHHLERGHNDSAAVYYERWVAISPDNPDALFGLAHAYSKIGKVAESRELYEALTQKYPEEPTVHLNLGIVYMQLGYDNLAEEEFQTVLYYDSSSTYALYNLGRMFETRGDSALAQNMFVKILTVDPDFYENPEEILDSLLKYAIPADSLMKEE